MIAPSTDPFRTFLSAYKPKNKYARDFTGDAIEDREMPLIKSRDQLLDYMRGCRACGEAIAGAKTAWKAYEAQQ